MLGAGKWYLSGLLLALFAWASPAVALDPARGLSQLHHTAWTIRDGAPPDIWALAQSADGYLWLGTGAGLYRFDGVRFEKVRPRLGSPFPSTNINALFVDRAGALWIGYGTGQISRYAGGRLDNFETGLPGTAVFQIVEDREGVLWAALNGRQRGGLARFKAGRWTLLPAELGLPAGGVSSELAAADGSSWVVVGTSLAVLRPGGKRFETTGEPVFELSRLTQARDGRIWLSGKTGVHALSERTAAPHRAEGPPLALPPAESRTVEHILVDRDGILWGTYGVGGVFRLQGTGKQGRVSARPLAGETFGLRNGLSSDLANPLLEDREGNIWIGTNLGLDRFRATAAVPAAGIPQSSRDGFNAAPGPDGSVYVAGDDSLFAAHADRPAEKLTRLNLRARVMFRSAAGNLWIGTDSGVLQVAKGRLVRETLAGSAGGRISAWMESRAGDLCVSIVGRGIVCRNSGHWQDAGLRLDRPSVAPVQMIYDASGGAWLNYGDRVTMVANGRSRTFGRGDGLAVGDIEIISAGRTATFIGGDFGIARFDGRRFETIGSDQQPDLSRVSGIVQTANGDLWVNAISGVIRIRGDRLADAFAHPERPLKARLFNLDDGLPGVAQQDSHSHTAIEATDGRLWFVTSHGLAWIDPAHIPMNALAPPVLIRSLSAGGREYPEPTSLRLPEGTSNLQIDYTALSLSVPERVRFRYQLEGVDGGWIDPGTRRQAFYTALGPGTYRFRVIAANNDGVWNRTGASLTFAIPPTFLQSYWFKALIGIGLLAAIWLLYSLRLNQMAVRMQGRLEERIGERERIARELHDTLLQGFQGLMFRFQAVMEQLPHTLAARREMELALDLADTTLAEGRDRVANLRSAAPEDDLSHMFAGLPARLSPAYTGNFRVITEGKPRPLHPIVHEEVSRLGEEAIGNALRHAKADDIEVSIVYHSREFRAYFRDDGVGIAPDILAHGGRRHHFGMTGMRERAEKIRGDFTISSRPGGGTEVTLIVPGSTAYAPSARRRRWYLPRNPKEA